MEQFFLKFPVEDYEAFCAVCKYAGLDESQVLAAFLRWCAQDPQRLLDWLTQGSEQTKYFNTLPPSRWPS